MSKLEDETVQFYLEARLGETRVSTQRMVTLRTFKDYRYCGLFGATINEMQAELADHVDSLINKGLKAKEGSA